MTNQPFNIPPDAESLLRTASRAMQAGHLSTAQAILQMLTRTFPDDVRGWRALAAAAATSDERRAALERILVLAPHDQQAQHALDQLNDPPRLADDLSTETARPDAPDGTTLRAVPAATPLHDPVSDYPTQPADDVIAVEQRPRASWMWPVIAIALLLLAGVACLALLVPSWFSSLTPIASAPGVEATVQGTVGPETGENGNAATTATIGALQSTAVPGGIGANETTVATTGAATPLPAANATTTPAAPQPLSATPLAPGALLELDQWRVSLPRQDRMLLINGAIGEVQPQGQFVLALVSLANTSDQPRHLPADLFGLIDNRGAIYRPTPALSTAYLAAYGRGLRGDLSTEDEIPAGGGYFSIPVIFDIPQGTQGLRLSLGDGSVGGWTMQP